MFTQTKAFAVSSSRRRRRTLAASLAAALAGGLFTLAAAGSAEAAPVSAAAMQAVAPGEALGPQAPIVQVRGGRKAAWILGGIAAVGAGAALAAQNRRSEGYGYREPYQPTYAPPPVYAPPAPVYAPAPVYGAYDDEDEWDYAPPPPPPVYPRGRAYGYGYGYSYPERDPSFVVDGYGRRTRLLPDGNNR